MVAFFLAMVAEGCAPAYDLSALLEALVVSFKVFYVPSSFFNQGHESLIASGWRGVVYHQLL